MYENLKSVVHRSRSQHLQFRIEQKAGTLIDQIRNVVEQITERLQEIAEVVRNFPGGERLVPVPVPVRAGHQNPDSRMQRTRW